MSTALPIPRCLLTALLVSAGLADAHAFETTQTREDVTLHYRDASEALAAPVRERIIETFFGAYLRERADFHPAAPTQVGIVIDPAYDGIAFVGEKAQAATITINPAWLAKHPGDIDLVTHEAMHIVQGYPEYANARVPGWLVKASPITRATATARTTPGRAGHCRRRSHRSRTSIPATGSPLRSWRGARRSTPGW